MGSILLVCSGNLCRSPMAVGLLRDRLKARGLDSRYRVFSAGVWAADDCPASPHAVTVMAERGIDISDHVAHTITAGDVSDADLILVMSREHAEAIQNTWPQYSWKLYRLSEMSGRRKDISDPFGGTVEAYRACAQLIAGYIDRGLERILELA